MSNVHEVLCFEAEAASCVEDAFRDAVDEADGREAHVIFNEYAYRIGTNGTRPDIVKEMLDVFWERMWKTR